MKIKTKVLLAALIIYGFCAPTSAQMQFPSDVDTTACTISSDDFSTWYANADKGTFTFANSVGFTSTSACDFYKWGAQMFLWMTSPEDDGGYVFTGSSFFNVSPDDDPNADNPKTRTFIQQSSVKVRDTKIGEVGQAGGSNGVLLSQGGSLVYYGIHVNDVFAYFLTGQMAGEFAQTVYPISQTHLDELKTYMGNSTEFSSVTLSDYNALTMEFKTSWIDASTLGDGYSSRYITIDAEIPTYDKSSDNATWTATDDTTLATLALVGVHIAGTVAGHPEMIWSTFEHIDNAPNNSYYYNKTDGTPTTWDYSSDGNYLFMATDGKNDKTANIECANLDSSDGVSIVASTSSNTTTDNTTDPPTTTTTTTYPSCEGGIVASNTYRYFPWGGAPASDATNGPKAAANNTMIISLNQAIIELLKDANADDVRQYYVQIGGIWTTGGTDIAAIPGVNAAYPSVTEPAQKGSTSLANATMETYKQHGTLNCFTCHKVKGKADTLGNSNTSFGPQELSHVYYELTPLSSSD